LWGLLNGNIGVAKTYLGEISDDSNAARGMALFGVIGGFGRTIGPIIGGFLSSPADNYPIFKNTIFETFPYALPSIVISVNCLIVFFISYFLLAETLPPQSLSSSAKNRNGYVLLNSTDDEAEDNNKQIEMSEVSNIIHESDENSHISDESKSTSSDISRDVEDDSLPIESASAKKKRLTFSAKVMVKVIGSSTLAFDRLKGITAADKPVDGRDVEAQNGEEPLLRYSNGSEDLTEENSRDLPFFQLIGYLLKQKNIFVSTFMYGSNAFTVIVMNEVFPLWIVTAPETGGFAFTSHDIGVATMICGTVAIALQLTLYPKLVDWYGILSAYRLSVIVFGISCIVTPSVSFVNQYHNTFLTWFVLVFTQLLQSITATWVLITVFVFINNSCYSHQRATVNAIGQTFASIGRLTGPYLGATLFAWSETNHQKWPFNYYFVFYLLAIVSVGNWYLSKILSPSIVRRKREPKKHVQQQETQSATIGEKGTNNAAEK
jgi:hypothetical protein